MLNEISSKRSPITKLNECQGLKVKYYLTDEIILHNKIDDIWIVINGIVLDLTNLFRENKNILLRELLVYAGRDISHFFDENGIPLEQISISGTNRPILPASQIPSSASENTSTSDDLFWWNDMKYCVGFVTEQERKIRIVNNLTKAIITLSVCEEDTIEIIKEKYNKRFIESSQKYVWFKGNGTGRLNEHKTLRENGFTFEGDRYGIYPSIWLYYLYD